MKSVIETSYEFNNYEIIQLSNFDYSPFDKNNFM
jgi:hypothetical protein